MNRSASFDDPLRPLSHVDLQATVVQAGTVLVHAEPALQAAAEPVAAALRRHGWTSSVAADLDRARWLTSVRPSHVVIILGQTPNWSARAVMTTRGASDRTTGSTLWGTPEVANYLPAGVSRYTTLRS